MLAFAVEKSRNTKIGTASTTYASIASCPADCRFKKSGACYGMQGHCGIFFRRLDAKANALAVAAEEAEAIRGLSGKHDLRIHTVGDCPSNQAARIVARSACEHSAKHGKTAWTYTHAWRKVDRAAWGDVSVIASCETPEEVREAQARGYAATLVVESFDSEKAYSVDGVDIVPCPAQTGRIGTCVECRLCMRDGSLRKAGKAVGLAIHGNVKRARKVLEEARGAVAV